ncbi:MAG: Inorganic pyrophosphatase [Candidatus Woesearchaeota archaeon]|nr:Inorganic pyrophosphatase [Candidatus Woesearchaeota archaeon]
MQNINYENIHKLIGKKLKVTIDRPMGSKHPKHGFIYPINYGFVKEIMAPDNEPLDAYVIGEFKPVKKFTGTCIAIIHRKDDNENKLVVAPVGKKYSDQQILALVEFQERYFESEVVRSREQRR